MAAQQQSDMKFINDVHEMQKQYYDHQQTAVSQYPGYFPYSNGYGYSAASHPETSPHQMGYGASSAHHPSAAQGVTDSYRAQCLMQTTAPMPSPGQGMSPVDNYPQTYPPTSSCMQNGLPPGCSGLGVVPPPGSLHQNPQAPGKSQQEIYPWMRDSRQNTKHRPVSGGNTPSNHLPIATGMYLYHLYFKNYKAHSCFNDLKLLRLLLYSMSI